MDATQTMVHAFISIKLDYSNSLLFRLPEKQIHKLQGIQNTAMRLVTDTDKYEHIAHILKELDIFQIDAWIVYKIILINFK